MASTTLLLLTSTVLSPTSSLTPTPTPSSLHTGKFSPFGIAFMVLVGGFIVCGWLCGFCSECGWCGLSYWCQWDLLWYVLVWVVWLPVRGIGWVVRKIGRGAKRTKEWTKEKRVVVKTRRETRQKIRRRDEEERRKKRDGSKGKRTWWRRSSQATMDEEKTTGTLEKHDDTARSIGSDKTLVSQPNIFARTLSLLTRPFHHLSFFGRKHTIDLEKDTEKDAASSSTSTITSKNMEGHIASFSASTITTKDKDNTSPKDPPATLHTFRNAPERQRLSDTSDEPNARRLDERPELRDWSAHLRGQGSQRDEQMDDAIWGSLGWD